MGGGANVVGEWVAFTSMLIWEDVSAGSHEFDWKIMKTTTKEQHMGAAFFPWLAGELTQSFGLWTLLPYVIILTVAMVFLWLPLRAGPRNLT